MAARKKTTSTSAARRAVEQADQGGEPAREERREPVETVNGPDPTPSWANEVIRALDSISGKLGVIAIELGRLREAHLSLGIAQATGAQLRTEPAKGGLLPKPGDVPTPPLPETLQAKHAEQAKQQGLKVVKSAQPTEATATLEQARKAVLDHAQKKGPEATKALLKKAWGVERVSDIKDGELDTAAQKYAQVVAKLTAEVAS